MKRTCGCPQQPILPACTTDKVVSYLFPVHDKVCFDVVETPDFVDFTIEGIYLACIKLKNNKAPGPGNIPPEILKYLVERKAQYVLNIYNELARIGTFPKQWKLARFADHHKH